jgi:pimeloyl-ACP methyl ester carboxylesterase
MSALNIRIQGTGKPVVFLHGFLESSTMWEYLHFPEHLIQCIYIDIPGHGTSPTLSDEIPSITSFARTICNELFSRGIHVFDLVGHSMGGYVALEIARIINFSPKVLLLNSNFWEDSDEKKKNRDRVISIIKKNKNLFIQEAIPGLFIRPNKYKFEIETLISEAKNLSEAGITYASLAMRNRPDLSLFAKSIAAKLVCIQGEKDGIVTEAEMQTKTAHIIPFITIPNAGHMSHIEASKVVEKTIIDLLLENI